MANKEVQYMSGNQFSPYMKNIPGLFMPVTGETDRVFRMPQITEHHGIVFHFAESDDGWRVPFAGGADYFGDLLEFMVIASFGPVAAAGREVFVIGFQRVVARVEKVFHIITHYPE